MPRGQTWPSEFPAFWRDNAHRLTGTHGMTRSTRYAAVSAIHLAPHMGHNPRLLLRGIGMPGTVLSGLAVSKADNLVVASTGVPQLPDGTYDAFSVSGFAQGATFVRPPACGQSAFRPGTTATGYE